jgi:hypothetical protein
MVEQWDHFAHPEARHFPPQAEAAEALLLIGRRGLDRE